MGRAYGTVISEALVRVPPASYKNSIIGSIPWCSVQNLSVDRGILTARGQGLNTYETYPGPGPARLWFNIRLLPTKGLIVSP